MSALPLGRGQVFARYFEGLVEGDALAWGITGVFAAFVVFVFLVAIRLKRKEAAFDEKMKKRRGY